MVLNLRLPGGTEIDLTHALKGKLFVNYALDHSGRLFVLAKSPNVVYRDDSPHLWTEKPYDYTVIEATEFYTTEYSIPNQLHAYYAVQPLPNDELLLDSAGLISVCGVDGNLKREFAPGEGVVEVQTNQSGMIWTGFSDAGTIGGPNGETGLIQWDHFGNKLWEFYPISGIDYIFHCYALNVVSDNETWFYYCCEFPLVKWLHGRMVDYWYPSIKYANEFALLRNYVLFGGKLDDPLLHLYQLNKAHQSVHLLDFEFDTTYDDIRAHGKHIILRRGLVFHLYDLADLLEWL